jgi:hypothetical protein
MTDGDYKYIYTKRRVYRLPADAKGMPIEEAYPGAQMPAFLKGAVVYDTPRGRVIAHREQAERGGDGNSGDAAQERRHAIGKDAAESRPPAAERPEALPALKEPPPGRRDNPMRFFRKDAPARSAAADPWQAVKIDCQEAFAMRPERSGIADAATAAREVRVLLKRHFPEGPAIAAQSLKAARRWNSAADRAFADGTQPPDRTDLARRWTAFCRDYASSLKEARATGLAPADCNPYADIDFSASTRERRDASRARNRERDGFER